MNDVSTPTVTAPEPDDLEKRSKGFNEELVAGKKCEKCGHQNPSPLQKYRMGLGATPSITDDGRIMARPSIFDDTKQAAPAPENTPTDASQADAPESDEPDLATA